MGFLERPRIPIATVALVNKGGVQARHLFRGSSPAGEFHARDVAADTEVEEADIVLAGEEFLDAPDALAGSPEDGRAFTIAQTGGEQVAIAAGPSHAIGRGKGAEAVDDVA